MRFRPEQHLRRQSDFRAVREQGRRINCGAFTFLCLRRPASPAPAVPASGPGPTSPPLGATNVRYRVETETRRLGVVASTAAVGHAVLRTRAKRRLREIFRRHQQVVPAGCDLILTARTAVTLWPMAELEEKFVEACRTAARNQGGL